MYWYDEDKINTYAYVFFLYVIQSFRPGMNYS